MTSHNPHEDDDAYGGPWIIRQIPKNPGNLLTTNDIANAVTSPGRDHMKMVGMIRHFAKSGYLHPVARESEGRRSYCYLPDQVLSAEVLLRMGEFGISEKNAAHAAWSAITVWKDIDFEGPQPPHRSPGMHVLSQYQEGARDWTFELWLFRHRENGNPRYEGRISANQRHEGTALLAGRDDGYSARSVFAVDLIDFLDDHFPRLFPHKMN